MSEQIPESDDEQAARAVSRVQIAKHVTKERLLILEDMLDDDVRRSKIAVLLMEFDEAYKVRSRVRHFADARDMKLVCWDILHGVFTEWVDYKGGPTDGGATQARILTVRRDYKYNLPYVVKIDNGEGEMQDDKTVRMAGRAHSLTVLLSDWEARRLAQTVYDHIRDWETTHFARRRDAMTNVLPTRPY